MPDEDDKIDSANMSTLDLHTPSGVFQRVLTRVRFRSKGSAQAVKE